MSSCSSALPPRRAGTKPDEAFRRGWDAANERRYNDAVIEYTEAIRLKPDDAVVYNDRGIVYLTLHQYTPALEDFTEAIRLKPDFAEAYNGCGNTYSNLGQHELAIASSRHRRVGRFPTPLALDWSARRARRTSRDGMSDRSGMLDGRNTFARSRPKALRPPS
jgi:hypothetical protein